MNILLIGGLGNIGAPITRQLAKQGHTVYVLGRKKSVTTPAEVIYISGNAEDLDLLTSLRELYQFDVVVNFAIQSTLQAEVNIKAFVKHIKQFIFISTVTVLDREKNVVLTENSECGNPFSLYAQTKLRCEQLFLNAYYQQQFPVTIIRPSQTYSHEKFPLSVKGKSYWSVIDRILHDKPVIIHGDGTSTWVSMHSDDFCRGFIPFINQPQTIGEIYHLTGDEILTWNMIYHELARQLNKPLKIVHIPTDLLAQSTQYDFKTSIKGDKQYSVIFDNHKHKQICPDFQCQITMQDGIRQFLEYMEAHPELKVSDLECDQWCDQVIERGVIQ
nr:NAD-dependent epimerase/dehydratase family protein [uncultured Tolumonas sp.]